VPYWKGNSIRNNKTLKILSVSLTKLRTMSCYFSSAWLRSSSVDSVCYDPLLANMLRGKLYMFDLAIITLLFDKCWNEAPIPCQLTQHNIHADALQRNSLLMNCDRIFTSCEEKTSPNPTVHDTFVWPRNLQHTAQNYMLFVNYQNCASGNGNTLDSLRTGPVYRSHIHKIKWMN